jgi:predicted transcriptional regulator
MRRVGLSTSQLRKYVKTLTKSELLEVLRYGTALTYRTTVKGRSFVEAFDELVKLID